MIFRQLFDEKSNTLTYLLGDPASGKALLIDPVLGQETRDLELLSQLNLRLSWVLETHEHADHITSANKLRTLTGCALATPDSGESMGADRYLGHSEYLTCGAIELEVRHTPGHTSGSASYVNHAHGMVFSGDTLLIRGCGRTDFQGGDAAALYASVHAQIFSLPGKTRVFPGHDYNGHRESSVAEEQAHNPRLGVGRDLASFVTLMSALNLPRPRLIGQAVPANRRMGAPDPFERLRNNEAGVPQADLRWWGEHKSDVRLIDVRQPEEYTGAMGHLPGAELVPLDTLTQVAEGWDPTRPLLIVCRSGARSNRGATALMNMGFSKVANLIGGTSGWYSSLQGTRT